MIEEINNGWGDQNPRPIYPKTCEFWLKENSKHYIEVLNLVTLYIKDFITVLESEGVETYYSRGELHDKKELQNIFELLINETYGHNG